MQAIRAGWAKGLHDDFLISLLTSGHGSMTSSISISTSCINDDRTLRLQFFGDRKLKLDFSIMKNKRCREGITPFRVKSLD
jgi:hypothetical protein